MGPYVLDFYCAEARLAVEVDGRMHAEADRAEHDRRRTIWLEAHDVAVLRIVAEDVRVSLDGVLAVIRTEAVARVRG